MDEMGSKMGVITVVVAIDDRTDTLRIKSSIWELHREGAELSQSRHVGEPVGAVRGFPEQ